MATINLYQIYLNKVRKFSVNDSERFRSSFVDAVNNVFAEMNNQVFDTDQLEYIDSFDDVIDRRLGAFTSITQVDSNAIISGRDYWSMEWSLERKSETNGLTHTITDDASNVVMSITNDVFSIVGDSVSGSVQLPSGLDVFKIAFESYAGGNRVLIDGDGYELTYTTGDSETIQPIGTASADVISSVSGFELKGFRFLTAGTVVYDYALNEGSGTTATSSVVFDDSSTPYTATIVGQRWDERFVEPSNSLSNKYLAPFNMGIEYHLQEGGEWALEEIADRERKWYGRGIRQARDIMQDTTTYVNPLGI